MVKIRKIGKKEQHTEVENHDVIAPPMKRSSEDPVSKKLKWINKQRVLVFASRGINYRHRHLMEDIKKLMPHHKTESKMERSKNLFIVNEICEVKNCNKALLFEGRRKQDLYMWMSNVPQGPSAKFLIENIYTMEEMKLTGNCLRGSRPLLSFDTNFEKEAHYILMKTLLSQIFGVPNQHPKSQPFFDRVYSFSIMDDRIWFRHFQILSEDGALVEIGPRFVLNPVKIFDGSFGGQPLWENVHYISPAKYRQNIKQKASNKYVDRVEQKAAKEASRPKTSYNLDQLDEIFAADPKELAAKIEEKNLQENDSEELPIPAKKIKKKKAMKGADAAFECEDKNVNGAFVRITKSPKKNNRPNKSEENMKSSKSVNKLLKKGNTKPPKVVNKKSKILKKRKTLKVKIQSKKLSNRIPIQKPSI